MIQWSILTGGNFWRYFFAPPCIEICQIIWQKRVSWKTRMNVHDITGSRKSIILQHSGRTITTHCIEIKIHCYCKEGSVSLYLDRSSFLHLETEQKRCFLLCWSQMRFGIQRRELFPLVKLQRASIHHIFLSTVPFYQIMTCHHLFHSIDAPRWWTWMVCALLEVLLTTLSTIFGMKIQNKGYLTICRTLEKGFLTTCCDTYVCYLTKM